MITGMPTIRIANVSESVSAATQTPKAITLVSRRESEVGRVAGRAIQGGSEHGINARLPGPLCLWSPRES